MRQSSHFASCILLFAGTVTTSTAQESSPQVPAKQVATKVSECDFPNMKKPGRVDNTCKAILDDIAQRLQQDPENTLVVVGNAAPTEIRKDLAAERAVNVKIYLTGGEAKQGIDPNRIKTFTGSAGGKTVNFWILPAGAKWSDNDTKPVDERTVKPVPDRPPNR